MIVCNSIIRFTERFYNAVQRWLIMILIENEKIIIKSLENKDLEGLRKMIENPNVYRYEPTFLT